MSDRGQTILVTGGAGYIGSHTCVQLLEAGYRVVVLDNLSNSSEAALARVREIAGGELSFHRADLCDPEATDAVVGSQTFSAVVHFAGLKAVGESCEDPIRYFHNNISGTINLLGAMERHGCRNLVFSSSATVYGDPETVPIPESAGLSVTNPYGRTKLAIENLLRDLCAQKPEWTAVLLRYFNPVGAHPSGRIGEDPLGIPNNLMPAVARVAVGRMPELKVFGNDYPTPDGTGVRDYIHVVDLAEGHLAALRNLDSFRGAVPINLGAGRGYSVLELVAAFERASGLDLPKRIVARRPGDIAVCYADPTLAQETLRWTAKLGIDAMCEDTWRWQSANPDGYRNA